jgi:hypothetical protein
MLQELVDLFHRLANNLGVGLTRLFQKFFNLCRGSHCTETTGEKEGKKREKKKTKTTASGAKVPAKKKTVQRPQGVAQWFSRVFAGLIGLQWLQD